MDRICDIFKFILKYLCFKKAWNSQFCWHRQNCNLVKVNFKESSKVEKFRNNVLKCHLFLHFLIQQKLLISVKKCWSQQNSRGVSHKFWVFFRQGITVQSFIIVVHAWQILRRYGLFWLSTSPISELIVKFVNRKYVEAMLKDKKRISGKNFGHLNVTSKAFVSVSLCPYYRYI